MGEINTLDFAKLLGFATVSEQIAEGVDFQDDTLGDKLGAKVGVEAVESDARLKRDITRVATRSDGLPIYSFRYLWDEEVYVGVMAQDLLRNELWRLAVSTDANGTFAVDYRTLGLRMTTLDAWQAEGMAALTRRADDLDFAKLLGFATVSEQIAAGVDFQDETLGDKLGAKIGVEATSDARLKRDIDHIATRSDGLPIYSFRYLWDEEVYVGVIAQDLLRNELWRPAVSTKANGTFAVDYAKLGLRMTRLDAWQAEGMAALTPGARDRN
jgi:hypothetical protein